MIGGMPPDVDATLTAEDAEALRKPFEPNQIGKLPRVTCKDCSDRRCQKHTKKKCEVCKNWISEAHIHLDYAGHAAVTDRLLKVDPFWSWEPAALAEDGGPLVRVVGKDAELWIRLTIKGVTRLGVGCVTVGSFEIGKQLIGDAIRNAAMRFGVALDLWSKEDLSEGAHDDTTPNAPERDEGQAAQDEADSAIRSELLELFNGLTTEYRDGGLERVRKAEIIKRKTNGAIGTVDAQHFDTVRRTLEAAHAAAAGGPEMEPAAETPVPDDAFPGRDDGKPMPNQGTVEDPPAANGDGEEIPKRQQYLDGIELYRSQLSDSARPLWLGWLDEHHHGKSIEALTDDELVVAFEALADIHSGATG